MTVAPPRCSSARGTARTSGMLLTVIYARVVAVRSIEKRNRAVPSGRPVDHGSPGHGPERARTADPLLANHGTTGQKPWTGVDITGPQRTCNLDNFDGMSSPVHKN